MDRSTCLDDLASIIVEIPLDHPTRVAIDGVDGVGKTTLADELVPLIRRSRRQVIRASVDGFHNPRVQRYRRGPASPEGYFLDSFNYPALTSKLLEPLGAGGSLSFRTAIFDHRTDKAVEAPLRIARPSDIFLFDGVFLLRSELRAYWDLTIWVEASFTATLDRAVHRDASGGTDEAAVRARYETRYVPGQRIYIEQCRPRENAEIVFDNTDFSHPEVKYRNIERTV